MRTGAAAPAAVPAPRTAAELSSALSALAVEAGLQVKAALASGAFASRRNYYGETFSLLLLSGTGILEPAELSALERGYAEKDRRDPSFHWEFNNYAILECRNQDVRERLLRFLRPLRFKGTGNTNWTLLRCAVRIKAGEDAGEAAAEAAKRLETSQLVSGLILDDERTRSFQYHCFSLGLVIEMYELTGEPRFLESFRKGLGFIRTFILRSGEALYVGRGQNQIFGYGCLFHVLAKGLRHCPAPGLLGDLSSVLGYVRRSLAPDGSIPLVLDGSGRMGHGPSDLRDDGYTGWYAYNNYFDYLPFFGAFAMKAAAELAAAADGPDPEAAEAGARQYRDADFIRAALPGIDMVVSRTGGLWTNEMSFPYLSDGEGPLTPCYGGEQFEPALYTKRGLPLPYCRWPEASIGDRAWTRLFGDRMLLVSPFGVLVRSYRAAGRRVEIRTLSLSPLPFRHNYLFRDDIRQASPERLEGRGLIVESDRPLLPAGTEYSAAGRLRRFTCGGITNTITLQL